MMVPEAQSGPPLSASLLLRLAEAVDGYRDGRPRWFLIARNRPHDISVYDSAEDAQAAQRKKKPAEDHVVLGPFVAGEEAAPVEATTRKAKTRKIKSVQIQYEDSTKPVELDPTQVDAIFLSASALDKFVYPYYSRVRGVEEAAKMRAQLMSSEEEPSFFHEPISGP